MNLGFLISFLEQKTSEYLGHEFIKTSMITYFGYKEMKPLKCDEFFLKKNLSRALKS